MHLTAAFCHQLNLFIYIALHTLPVFLVAFTYSSAVHAQNTTFNSHSASYNNINDNRKSKSNNNNGNFVLWSALADPDTRVVQFEKSLNDFIQCTLNDPASMCRECRSKMNVLQENYLALTTADHDDDSFTEVSINPMVKKIAKQLYDSASEDIWIEIGECDRCSFPKLIGFFDLLDKFDTCIKNNKNESCSLCLSSYAKLNDFYMEMENSGNTCLDTNEQMSEAWEDWKKLKCHINARSDPLVIWLSVSIILVTLLLYIISYQCCKRDSTTAQVHTSHSGLDVPSAGDTITRARTTTTRTVETTATATTTTTATVEKEVNERTPLLSV